MLLCTRERPTWWRDSLTVGSTTTIVCQRSLPPCYITVKHVTAVSTVGSETCFLVNGILWTVCWLWAFFFILSHPPTAIHFSLCCPTAFVKCAASCSRSFRTSMADGRTEGSRKHLHVRKHRYGLEWFKNWFGSTPNMFYYSICLNSVLWLFYSHLHWFSVLTRYLPSSIQTSISS